MLRNALRKDLLLNARHLFWGILPCLRWVAYALSEDGAPVGMLRPWAALIGRGDGVDHRGAGGQAAHATALLASLPVPRSTLVLVALPRGPCGRRRDLPVVAALAAVLPWSPQGDGRSACGRC